MASGLSLGFAARSKRAPNPILTSIRAYSASTSLINTRTIQAPHCGHIRVLSLNRPEAKNAISKQLLSDLKAELSSLDCGPKATRVLIITSNVPQVFCAGADLKERRGFTLDDTREFLFNLRSTFAQLASLPIPTISAINGVALGGGLELALCTTFRVAASIARLGLPETRLGIIPGAGATFRLPALIGAQKARDMILRGNHMFAAAAKDIGLVDECCTINAKGEAEERVLVEAVNLANEICNGGPIAVLQALKAVNSWQAGEAAENAAYEEVLGTADRLEALQAFAEKRKPRYKGE